METSGKHKSADEIEAYYNTLNSGDIVLLAHKCQKLHSIKVHSSRTVSICDHHMY